MNRSVLFFSLLFLLPGWAAGQDWAPIGTKWHYYGFGFYTDCYYGYSTMESVRDTVVQGKTARVLQITSFGEDNMPEREEIMYGDADRIYHYLPEADSFYVLYDFSAVAGDTLFIRTTPFQDYYGRFGLVSQFILLVDSTSSMIIDGDTLRVQHVHGLQPEDPLSGAAWGWPDIFIEKIGARTLMFGLPSVLPLAGCWGGLRCYSDETLSVSFASQACDYLTSLDAEWENPDWIRLWPNPAREHLQVAYCPDSPLRQPLLHIRNSAGQLVIERALPPGGACLEAEISLSHLPAGLYNVALYEQGRLLAGGRVVLQ